jgi:hypothetical protein
LWRCWPNKVEQWFSSHSNYTAHASIASSTIQQLHVEEMKRKQLNVFLFARIYSFFPHVESKMVQNRPWTNRNKSPNMCVQSPTPNIDHNRDMMIFHQNHSGSAWSFTGWSGAPPVDVVTVTRNFVTVCNGTGNGFSTTITITQVLPLFQNMLHTFHITCHERHYYRDSKISVIACTPHQAIWHGASCFFCWGKSWNTWLHLAGRVHTIQQT